VIAHVVLFQPRADLSNEQRESFARAFERAVAGIPQLRRAQLGERQTLDRLYDRLNARDFSHIAILEFDSESDLRTYLDHPAHEELGQRFYETAEAALVYDFAMKEGDDAITLFRAR
jgi:stress responsive alpha/beta barrel protein